MIFNEIVSLISLSGLQSFVYRSTADFCVLICILLLLSSISFLVASLGYSIYGIMSSPLSGSFTSFPIWISFTSFTSLIAVARISKTVTNRSVKSGHHCLVFDVDCKILYLTFRGNSFIISPLSMMLAVCLSYVVFIILT